MIFSIATDKNGITIFNKHKENNYLKAILKNEKNTFRNGVYKLKKKVNFMQEINIHFVENWKKHNVLNKKHKGNCCKLY